MSYKVAVRIVNVDFYMSSPVEDLDVIYSEFRGSATPQVPVIRIFGSTDTGNKMCLHIHGVFPYLYIPYDGEENADILKYQIAANIDKAINISFGQAASNSQHVYKVSLVSGIPFYGYHGKEHQFFKIFLYNPNLIRKASNLLQSEVILGKLYQPHESHIPYILQFMIDYNLHGMSRILLSDFKLRTALPHSPPKQSLCQLEADALCDHIINRFEVAGGKMGINPGIAALWEDEKQRLRDHDEDSEIGACLTLENSQVPPTKTHLIFKQALHEKLLISEELRDQRDPSLSVYAAETPRNKKLRNASFIDLHSSTSSSQSLDTSMDLNATLVGEERVLFDVLKDLALNVGSEEREDDSILSQVPHQPEDDDNDMDLSISLGETTPFKHIYNEPKNELADSLLGDDLDVTFIPQLDGQNDSGSEEESSDLKKGKMQRKLSSVKKYGALPIVVSPAIMREDVGDSSLNKKNRLAEDAKRILNFYNEGQTDVTLCEESLECVYQQQKLENICNISIVENTNNAINCQQQATRKIVSRSVAEVYDYETNFKPKEGCSSILTQNSDLSDLKLSFKSSCDSINHKKRNLEEETKDVAELYDLETLKAKEEYSTIFTQNSNPAKSDFRCDSTPNSELDSLYDFLKNKPQNDCLLSGKSDETLGRDFATITLKRKAPTRTEVLNSLEGLNIPKVFHETPFFSDLSDVTGSVEIGYSVLKVSSRTTAHLEDFKGHFDGIDVIRRKMMPANLKWSLENLKNFKLSFCTSETCTIRPVKRAPSVREVERWIKARTTSIPENQPVKQKQKFYIPASPGRLDESDADLSLTLSLCASNESSEKLELASSPVLGKNSKKRKVNSSNNSARITGVTVNNTFGFKNSLGNYQDAKTVNEFQYITIFSLELHIQTRGDLKPDPVYDPIRAVFYSIVEDSPEATNISGVIVAGAKVSQSEVRGDVVCVETEEDLLVGFVELVHKWDPDILVGYETELLSWGYLIDRAQVLDVKLLGSLSRIVNNKDKSYVDDRGLMITGRIILDLWRLLRHEIALQSYTFESIVYHILHKRVPVFSFKDLTVWWQHPSSLYRHRTISHYLFRVETIIKIMEQLDLIGRTSELARLFGIQFFEVLSRGSQFRVESMMLRLAKPMNYIPVSPSVHQRAKMKAPEFLPLILEPESKLYCDPVIVLDFQSLYPSVMIAYNYCFSTCAGRVSHLGKNTPFEFGATQLKVSKTRVVKLLDADALNFSPCGVAFVKKHVRDGVMPRMLREIIDTRLMVKKSMKKNKDNKVLQKVLHNRQLGLKLIANVTYGYTAANFSGRMPSVELGDSVVSKGRETLQRAIEMVENSKEWGAKVVYGDTDSLFVLIPGKSKEEAFEVGQKIADAITNDNPDPVKLKLEKVYCPCILQTKKRYVGYMYESPEQKDATYDAKGIETVRRDSCPAVAKILEKCLRLLFETKNVSLVKQYVVRQFHKILTGRVSLQDLTFAKEYRGASGYRPGACVPALELTRKWTAVDKRNEPRSGQRVPYVIANGPPGVPLIRLVRSPWDFLNDPSLRPNAIYYITKVVIPPINRCFNLIGANVTVWFSQMPRKQYQYLNKNTSPGKKSTISQYFSSTSCAACGEQTQSSLCSKCSINSQTALVVLHEKINHWEKAYCETNLICECCTGIMEKGVCVSLDCPVLYRVHQTARDVQQTDYVRQIINSTILSNR